MARLLPSGNAGPGRLGRPGRARGRVCRHGQSAPASVAQVRKIIMLDLEYRHVDVFSRRALRGNGLVVVLNAARLRIFTEDEELGFAGHPVLGAAAVLHSLLPAVDTEQAWALTVAARTVAA